MCILRILLVFVMIGGFNVPLLHAKENWMNKGVDLQLSEKADYISVYKGGIDRKVTFVGLAELGLGLDTAKLGLWPGGEFYLHATNAQGHMKPSGAMVGDLQGVNNNEAPRSSRLYEFWYQQHLLDDKLALLVGVHDINTVFMVSENAGLYVNGAFGVQTTMSANIATSAYPLAAPALVLTIKPVENLELFAGIYDGNPGDSAINKHSTHLAIKEWEGFLSIAEMDYHFKFPMQGGLPGTIKTGGWHHSGNFTDVKNLDGAGNAERYDDNYGGYVILDGMVWREKEDQGLGVFVMGSGAPKDRNRVQRQVAGGVNYTGLIPGRDADVLGLAFTSTQLSSKARLSNGKDRGETTLEGAYQIRVNEHFSLQPDIQYVITPSGDKAIKNASVFTLRTKIVF